MRWDDLTTFSMTVFSSTDMLPRCSAFIDVFLNLFFSSR